MAIAAIPMALGRIGGPGDGLVTQWSPGYVVPPGQVLSAQQADTGGVSSMGPSASIAGIGQSTTGDGSADETVVAEDEAPVNPAPLQYTTHEVSPGETLFAIADRYGVSIDYLIWNNPEIGTDPDSLIIGQSLLVPGTSGLVYDVRLGDTINDIALTFGVDPEAVVAFAPNGLASPDLITEGMVLVLPGAVPPAPPVVAEEPAADTPIDSGTDLPIAVASVPDSVTGGPAPAAVTIVPSVGFAWPIAGTFWSGFGPRWGSFHKGIDLGAGYGSGIAAAATGQVILSTYSDNGYGNYVIVRHDDGSETLYAHMSERYVSLGQWVSQGEIIGAVGCTGWCLGDHLHFEIHVGGSPVDPLWYLP